MRIYRGNQNRTRCMVWSLKIIKAATQMDRIRKTVERIRQTLMRKIRKTISQEMAITALWGIKNQIIVLLPRAIIDSDPMTSKIMVGLNKSSCPRLKLSQGMRRKSLRSTKNLPRRSVANRYSILRFVSVMGYDSNLLS